MTEVKFTSDLTVEHVDSMGHDDLILKAMLVSTSSDSSVATMDADAKQGRINFLMANRHGSPFEHSALCVRVHAPIAVFREWQRHRAGHSYNEQSGRYTKFEPLFYIPNRERPLLQVGKPGAYTFERMESDLEFHNTIEKLKISHKASWDSYVSLMEDDDVAKEVARGVIGTHMMSSMYHTANPRSLFHFLSLRRLKSLEGVPKYPSFPMWEIDECAEQLERIVASLWPKSYKAFVDNGRVAP